MKQDKRGFLLAEETLKVILAVIAIAILAFLLFSLYKAGKGSKDLELAKESIDFLEQEINAQKTQVDIYNPEGWQIISWPYEGVIPKSCSNIGWNSCLCIFPKGFTTLTTTGYAEDSDKGACIENKNNLIVKNGDIQSPIKIEPPLGLSINYQTKTISKS